MGSASVADERLPQRDAVAGGHACVPGRREPGHVAGRGGLENDVLELIQYAAATAEVYARPLLIVPPQINKFYIFDLAPGKSIVEYLVK